MLKRRIPTIIGLFLLVVGAIAGVVFINQGTDFLPRAAPEYVPQKVKITNLTESGFTVSWVTKEPTIGFVKVGESSANLATTAIDDRDQLTGSSGEYRSHYISVQGLRPATPYYFKLGSQKNQLYDNNGQAFSLTTPPALPVAPQADSVYGTVVTAANTPAEGAIVYLNIEGTTPVSALVKQNGNWAVNLATARTLDLSAFATYDPADARINIFVQPATGEAASGVTTTNNDKPVPTITLGQTFDFVNEVSELPEEIAAHNPEEEPVDAPSTDTPSNQSESSPEGEVEDVTPTPVPDSQFSLTPITVTDPDVDNSLTITSIPQDGSIVNTPQPNIDGKAPANAVLTISVHSNQAQTGQAIADASGKWQWTPPAGLEPGEHTVTVAYTDAQGILHKITRSFVVQASDLGAPSYSATPSATPATTPRPTATPIPTPVPTPEPVEETPVVTPTPTPRTQTATTSAAPVAGSTFPTMLLLMLGMGILAAGFVTLGKHQG